ncbi:hypothetical protein M5689_008099 [Euphorbia peplus]|nr:hypothetical protein M5689_008099 [Euphorbia peplus]
MKANSVSVPDGLADKAQALKLIQAEHGLETTRLLHGEPSNQNHPFLDGPEDKMHTVYFGSLEQQHSSQPKMPVNKNSFLSSGTLTFSCFSGIVMIFSSCMAIGLPPSSLRLGNALKSNFLHPGYFVHG